jgi:hypothetical protein
LGLGLKVENVGWKVGKEEKEKVETLHSGVFLEGFN